MSRFYSAFLNKLGKLSRLKLGRSSQVLIPLLLFLLGLSWLLTSLVEPNWLGSLLSSGLIWLVFKLIYLIFEVWRLRDFLILEGLIPPLFFMLFGLGWLLARLLAGVENRREYSKGLIPPLLFLFILAGLIYLLLILLGSFGLILSLVITFGLPWLLPAMWIKFEEWCWMFSLGGSPAAQMLRDHALKDFKLSINQSEKDEGLQRPVAALVALITRLVEFPRRYRDLKKEKVEEEKRRFGRVIDDLNEGWRSGLPPAILNSYMGNIEEASDIIEDDRKKLRGLCAVANIKYLLGDLKRANALAEENRDYAEKPEVKDDLVLKWMAAYAYFGSTLYLGKFDEAIEFMAERWRTYYEELGREELGRSGPPENAKRKKEEIIDTLSKNNLVLLNPVLAVPRHFILAAAFNGSLNGSPIAAPFKGSLKDREKYWPSEARDQKGKSKRKFAQLEPDKLERERKWVERWYEEAIELHSQRLAVRLNHNLYGYIKRLLRAPGLPVLFRSPRSSFIGSTSTTDATNEKDIHRDEKVSLDLSHAYAGFYFTLLYHRQRADVKTASGTPFSWLRGGQISAESPGIDVPPAEDLREKAKDALKEIKDSPPVSRYVKSGFSGIYKLAIGNKPEDAEEARDGFWEKTALEDFREAAEYSAISGNRFAVVDCLFKCCHAVAAERDERYLKPEVDYYLKEAGKAANKAGCSFYRNLYDAARSEISRIRRERREERWKRILGIFRSPEDEKKKKKQRFDAAIKNSNEGWKSGMPPEILKDYVKAIKKWSDEIEKDIEEWSDEIEKDIEEWSDEIKEDIEEWSDEIKEDIEEWLRRERLRGLCTVASIKYLLGDLTQSYALARENWRQANALWRQANALARKKRKCAEKREAENYSVLKYSVLKSMAGYAYFGSTLYLGEFEQSMEGVADEYRAQEDREKLRTEIDKLVKDDRLTVNPVLGTPRHLILGAAVNGSPMYDRQEKRYWPWPNEAQFHQLSPAEQRSELKWAKCWYDKAKKMISENEQISLDFSHAYAGFYFTLLQAKKEAKEALERIPKESSSLVSRYVRSGFYGIYELAAENDPGEALKHLRDAAAYSSVSGNRFVLVDCLFKCCHAVAAAREAERDKDGQHLKPEVDNYLKEARELAGKIDRPFYYGLHEAACSEVSKIREGTVRAERHWRNAESKLGRGGKRILRIFQTDPANDSARH